MKKLFEVVVYIVLGIFIGLLVAGGLFLTVRGPSGTAVVLLPSATPTPIFVYLTGAVNRAGVYQLPPESHLVDAVQAAGGFADGADLNQVNLASSLKDGQQIVIPGATGAGPECHADAGQRMQRVIGGQALGVDHCIGGW